MDELFFDAWRYYKIVEEACLVFINYINETEQEEITNKFDFYNYIHTNHIVEKNIFDRRYYFHGGGCTIEINGTPVIDWDFGCRSFWCGIDPFKMARTLNSVSDSSNKSWNGQMIQEQCEEYMNTKGYMYKFQNQYYFDLVKMNPQKPLFPNEYDTLLVEYHGKTKEFPKNKSIDRFIRKSQFIYKGIDDISDVYTFVFFNKGVEVQRIKYSDIAYHDNAVKIANEEILKRFKTFRS
jgi:hypothetical protein